MTLTSVSHAYSKWLPATCCSVSYSNTRQSFNPGYYSSFRGTRNILPTERAGKDILLGDVFPSYPNPRRPVDFLICEPRTNKVLAVGLARYDSDRGGAQEDDRTGGYKNCADEILSYCKQKRLKTKVIFLNDGPGLLLGSMWRDYAEIEKRGKGKVLVTTLRMLDERLTSDWLVK